MKAFLEVQNLSKSFVINKRELNVLKDIDLQIYKGDFVCIVGPSGCGKSTLLGQIAGFEQPDSGGIFIEGQKALKPQTNRVMVFQDFNQLFPWKTLLANVVFPLKIHKIGQNDKERANIARRYLSMVKLEGFESFYPHQLSGGMKQRAAIARALAINSEILLMDEPFGSLDAQSRSELQNMLVQIWQETGITIIFVTHDITEAILLSNRIVVMGRAPVNIKVVIANDLERPRDTGDLKFSGLYHTIYDLLKV
ncbi:MAG: ABC transporter ATP-binding protein [Desulfitobacterium hafniense]|nr:ABC transporter ATP-binding protein [Desulfitobacterium hafniense]